MVLNVSFINNIITYLFFTYVLLGPSPFFVQGIAENANVSGSQDLFRQVLLLFIFIMLLMVNRLRFSLSDNLFFALFACYAAISILWSDFPFYSFRRVALLFIVFTICYVIVKAQGSKVFHKLFKVLLFIQLANLLYLVFIPSVSFTELGFKGLHVQKNTLGVICVFSIIISIALFNEVKKVYSLTLLILSVLFLVISESKTNQGLVIFILIPIFLGIFSIEKAKIFIYWVFGIFVVLFFAAGFVPNYLISNYASLIDHETLTGRGTIWLVLLDNIEDKPYFGFGYGGFWGVGEDSLVFLSDASWLDKIGEGHNGFLDLLVNLGVVGLFLYLAIIVSSLRSFSCKVINLKNLSLLSLYIFVFLHNFTESSLVNVVQMVWVLFILMSMYFVNKEV